MKDQLFEKMAKILKEATLNNGKQYWTRTGNDAVYEEFLSYFPKTKLPSVTIDEYTVGDRKKYPNNFCYWVEFKLGRPISPSELSAIGSYAIGSARTNFVYKSLDAATGKHKLVWVKQKGHSSNEEAYEQVWNLHQYWLNQEIPKYDLAPNERALMWSKILEADQKEDPEKWGDFKMPKSRKLRMLVLYQPENCISINSYNHIREFLGLFGKPITNSEIKNFQILHELYYEFCDWLKSKDNNVKVPTTFGFGHLLYSEELGIDPKINEESKNTKVSVIIEDVEESSDTNGARNILLYGPPGTGKTYKSMELAVKYADPTWYRDNIESNDITKIDYFYLQEKYNELLKLNRISFVTFHQSYSYEDFVEGIRADTNDEGTIKYEIHSGIFKTIATMANESNYNFTSSINVNSLDDRKVWKMSLGDTQGDDAVIYDECINNNYILLGYGDHLNFTEAKNLKDIQNIFELDGKSQKRLEKNLFPVHVMSRFKFEMKPKDLVIITDGNRKFRAIGEITSDYFYLDNNERTNYQQARKVIWHRVFSESQPSDLVMKKYFSQMTLYEISKGLLKTEVLLSYLRDNGKKAHENYVLVIDEINRGNISNIFGELITLIELDKRKGASHELSVTLPYSKDRFSVPKNLTIIGTMNTSDHSLTGIDIALRRRFEFEELLPDSSLLSEITVFDISLDELLNTLNSRIEVLLGRDYLIGHSYFLPLKDVVDEKEREKLLALIFENQIIPLLQSYFYEDWERIQWVLNDQSKEYEDQFIQLFAQNPDNSKNQLINLFPNVSGIESQIVDRRYTINKDAFAKADAYQNILKQKNNR